MASEGIQRDALQPMRVRVADPADEGSSGRGDADESGAGRPSQRGRSACEGEVETWKLLAIYFSF